VLPEIRMDLSHEVNLPVKAGHGRVFCGIKGKLHHVDIEAIAVDKSLRGIVLDIVARQGRDTPGAGDYGPRRIGEGEGGERARAEDEYPLACHDAAVHDSSHGDIEEVDD